MMLQTIASITAAFTLVSVSVPKDVSRDVSRDISRGEAPTFQNDPDLSYANVVQNFRQSNQLLLIVEDAAEQLEPTRAARVKPVLAVLEEQLDEAAHQLSVAGEIENQKATRASAGLPASKLDPEIYKGINADILAATDDLKHLAAAMETDTYL